MRPELFGAMIMKVPFVDVTTSMVDDTLPLTLHEYDEWGNPNDENVFKYPFLYYIILFIIWKIIYYFLISLLDIFGNMIRIKILK